MQADDDIVECICPHCKTMPRRKGKRRGPQVQPLPPPPRLYPFAVSWDANLNLILQMSRRWQKDCNFVNMVAKHPEKAEELKNFRLQLCHIRKLLFEPNAHFFVSSEQLLSCIPADFIANTAGQREEYKKLAKEGLQIADGECNEGNLLLKRGLLLVEQYYRTTLGLEVFLYNWTTRAVLPDVKLLKENRYSARAEEYIKDEEKKLENCSCVCTVKCPNCVKAQARTDRGAAQCTLKRRDANGPLLLLPANNKIERRTSYYAHSCPGTCGIVDCPNVIPTDHVGTGRPTKFAVVRTEDRGFCLVTLQDIEAGTIVVEQFGLISHFEELEGEDHSYTYDLAGGYLLWDAKLEGSLYRFMNHSCGPNLNVVDIYTGGFQAIKLRKRIVAVANRQIKAGEELNIDYHPEKGLSAKRPKPSDQETDTCRCKSKTCRGWC